MRANSPRPLCPSLVRQRPWSFGSPARFFFVKELFLTVFAVLIMGLPRPGRRARVHEHHGSRLDDLLRTLRQLDGFDAGADPAAAAAAIGPDALQVLKDRVAAFGHPHQAFPAPDGPPLPQEALRQILGSHANYAGESSSTVSFDIARLGLPSTTDSQVDAFGGEAGAPYSVEVFCKRYVLLTLQAGKR